MKKVIKLNENDIESLVKKIIKETSLNEEFPQRELDRKSTNFRRSDFEPYKRETGIQSIFGKYSDDVPPQVIQYMRKNPSSIVKRLVDIYGVDKIYEYIESASSVTESYDINDIINRNKKTDKKGINRKS